MEKKLRRIHRNGLLALSPLLVMASLFILLSIVFGGFHKVPLLIVFTATCAYSLFTLRGMSFEARISEFSRGAGDQNLLLMVWIFILAGAFASTAKAMGAVDASVNLTLRIMPNSMLLAGVFVASCFVSLSIGTSVGTIVALVPIATGLSAHTGIQLPLIVAAVVGGSFFGDNLSFISDTTVVATRTQGCCMSDKFKVNFGIALPAAVITFLIYVFLGWGNQSAIQAEAVNVWKVLPYVVVLVVAIMGVNVLLVLMMGIVLTGVVGIAQGAYDVAGFFSSICTGIGSMSELIVISMMAGGLLSVIRRGGGITWMIRTLTHSVHTSRGAEFSIALLVSLTNLCTANNTVAILSVGYLSRDISQKYGVDSRKSASILDTFSCCVQGLIPYGAQMLMAAGLSAITPTAIIPYLFYPVLLGVAALLAIAFRLPRFSEKVRQRE